MEGYYKAYISFKNYAGVTITNTMDITLYTNPPNTLLGGSCRFGDQINPKLGFVYTTKEIVVK